MPVASVVSFSSLDWGLGASALGAAAIIVARWRRIDIPAVSAWLISAGIVLLALAATGPVWHRPRPGTIAVMVDLSPSTRGARFRNPDFLRRRLSQLIGDAPFRLIAFAAENRPLNPAGPFDEMPADRTVFSPANADAIVLFSDARFDLPDQSPPVYVALDEGLENVADGSVRNLEIRGNSLAATIANSGPPRAISFEISLEISPSPGTPGEGWGEGLQASRIALAHQKPPSPYPSQGVPGEGTRTGFVGTGTFLVTRPIPGGASAATVKLNPSDLWPENDSLTLVIPPVPASERWWIGQNPPGDGWRSFGPEQTPVLKEQYLGPAVIVIDNQPAERFTPAQLDCLVQYVRDLGGSLLIVGGDHALAAGGYAGTALEQISPLASWPPTPAMRWLLLADGSGSMAQEIGGGVSRWQAATGAMVKLLPALPPSDPVQIGQFSDAVKWWLGPGTVADAAKAPLPPPGLFPHGPTNLESALTQIADQADSNLPSALLLLSDCDAQFDHPDELANLLSKKHVRSYVLAIAHGSGLETIRRISADSGGTVFEESDPRKWERSMRNLLQAALPPAIEREPATVVFENGAKSLGKTTVAVWNRSWLKPDAQRWAGTIRRDTEVPMAGYWRVGSGCVTATAFQPEGRQIGALASLIAEKPRDPRFSVQLETGGRLHVTVDAADAGRFLNDLAITLDLAGDDGKHEAALEQTAPGRYETSVDSSRESRIATLRIANKTIARFAVAGRYPPEFDAVGNDRAAMGKLAQGSGGTIIWPSDSGRIAFHWPRIEMPAGPWICLVGLILVSAGVVGWRVKRSDAW
jgi:hypothetical protein